MKNTIVAILFLTFVSLPVFSQNENVFGIWTVKDELNEFGDSTGEKYITTLEPIRGTFSNSANNNAPLNVTIKVISRGNSRRVIITPYLGARNVPGIPFGSRREYSVAVRDNAGETFRSRVYLSLDNISFDFYNVLQENFTIMHNAFLKGGLIRIRMETHENERNKESYSFDISNANQYTEAYAYLLSHQ
jgi:hypothetical protein